MQRQGRSEYNDQQRVGFRTRRTWLTLALAAGLALPAMAHFARVDAHDGSGSSPAAGVMPAVGFEPADSWENTGTITWYRDGSLVAPGGLNYTVVPVTSPKDFALHGKYASPKMIQRDLEYAIGANPTWVSFLVQPKDPNSIGGVVLNTPSSSYDPTDVDNAQFIGVQGGLDLVVDTDSGADLVVANQFTPGLTSLVVIKIEHGVGTLPNDDLISVWVDQDVDNLNSGNAAVFEYAYSNTLDRIDTLGITSFDTDGNNSVFSGAIIDDVIISDNPADPPTTDGALSEVTKTGTGASGSQIFLQGRWDGGSAVNSDMTDAANWDGDVLPDFFSNSASLTFSDVNNGRNNPVFDVVGMEALSAEVISGTTDAYTFTGNGFQLGGGAVVNNGAGLLTLDTGTITALNASRIRGGTGSGGVTVLSDISLPVGSFYIDAYAPVAIDGNLTGPAEVEVVGSSTLDLTDPTNDFTGQLYANHRAIVQIHDAGALGVEGALSNPPDPAEPKLRVGGGSGNKPQVAFTNPVALSGSIVLHGHVNADLDLPRLAFDSGVNTLSGDLYHYNGGAHTAATVAAGASLEITGLVANIASNTVSRLIEFRGDGDVTISGATDDGLTLVPDPDDPNELGYAATRLRSGVGLGTLTLSGGSKAHSGETGAIEGALVLVDGGSNNNIPNSTPIAIGEGALLDVAGLSGSTLALTDGQTLQHDGSANGTVIASAGSTIAPGVFFTEQTSGGQAENSIVPARAIGTAQFNNLELDDGATLEIEIGVTADRIDVTGAFAGPTAPDGVVTVNLINAGVALGAQTILATDDVLSLDDFAAAGQLAGLVTLQLADGDTDLQAVVAAPANPAATVLVAVGDQIVSDRADADELADVDQIVEYLVTEDGAWLFNGVKIDGATCCGAGQWQLANPWGIAADADGNIYVAERVGSVGAILKFDSNGNLLAVVAEEGPDFINGEPRGIAIDSSDPANEILYFSVGGADDAIYKVELDNGNAFSTFAAMGFDPNDPNRVLDESEGVAVLPSGNVLVGDYGTSPNSYIEFEPNGVFVDDFAATGPQGAAYDPFDDRLLLSRDWSDGSITTIPGDTLAGPSPAGTMTGIGLSADVERIFECRYITRRETGEIYCIDEDEVVVSGLAGVGHMLVTSNSHPLDLDLDGLLLTVGGGIDDAPLFFDCINGARVSTPPPGCSASLFRRADLRGDGDVDMWDLAEYQIDTSGF